MFRVDAQMSQSISVLFDSEHQLFSYQMFLFLYIVTKWEVKLCLFSPPYLNHNATCCFFVNAVPAAQKKCCWIIFLSDCLSPFVSVSAVRSLARRVDDLECFYHLFLPGGWRSFKSKEAFFSCSINSEEKLAVSLWQKIKGSFPVVSFTLAFHQF